MAEEVKVGQGRKKDSEISLGLRRELGGHLEKFSQNKHKIASAIGKKTRCPVPQKKIVR